MDGLRCKNRGKCSVSKCPPDWDQVGESCYVWSQEQLSWGEAEQHCQTLGGHLASVTSQEVLDYMHQQVGQSQYHELIASDLSCRVKILMERLGSERQTRQRKVTGNGQIALHGTWPHGLNQHCLVREKLIKAARPSLEKLAKIIGITIHATMHTL